jgi:hypothetical protein
LTGVIPDFKTAGLAVALNNVKNPVKGKQDKKDPDTDNDDF